MEGTPPPPDDLFREHIERELRGIRGDAAPAFEVAAGGATGEPRVTAVDEDLVGVCLSGGGIRSATFNLGVLQGLHKLDVLKSVHYLSTVSGGGYIGGWWSRWRAREEARGGARFFPEWDPNAPEVRHLREFSNFLSPRWGLLETDTGYFIVGMLAALVPAIVAAASLILLVLWGVFGLAAWMSSPAKWSSAAAFAAPTLAALVALEAGWVRRKDAPAGDRRPILYDVLASVVTVLGTAVWLWLRDGVPEGASIAASMRPSTSAPVMQATPYLPAIAAAVVGAPLLVARFFVSRAMGTHRARTARAALDRVTARVWLLALGWAASIALWQAGLLLARGVLHWSVPGVSTIGAGGLFAWAWRRLSAQPNKPTTRGLTAFLRPLVPQILAYLALGLLVATAAMLIAVSMQGGFAMQCFLAVIAALLATLVFFDPSEVSLHSSYRSRIARAYLGSAPEGALPSRYTQELEDDDVPIAQLLPRPLHLVCCAANDLAGDRLRNLSRGARSASISRQGFAIGTSCRMWSPDYRPPTLSSALTASAAAFNSNMGSQSIALGKVVTFLMTALNLRLGLWLTHPRHPNRRAKLPGLLFFKEALSLTRADRYTPQVHLSDGAHFENLGLYELVRRHCRYVVCSDCGQDPDVAFDDVGNALRRVRQDFGVEITIDLDALRPGPDGLSRQNVAVGDIHYGETDHGVLVLVKPSLTGDEPDDVMQYRSRNLAFPHESTGDQFYDAAQWESYRRLGEHVALTALRVADRLAPGDRTPARVFAAARQEWYPTPPGLPEKHLELTKRRTLLEQEVEEHAPLQFVRELAPELAEIAAAPPNESGPITQEEWRSIVELLLQATQLIEDVWLGCQLDAYWTHPLNVGWMNYFQRWTSTPSFRMWWPVLRPIWGPGARRFVEEHFDLDRLVDPKTHARLVAEKQKGVLPEGLASTTWCRDNGAPDPTGKRFFSYQLRLTYGASTNVWIQVGVAAVKIEKGAASFLSSELYVPPRLWGAGIGGSFLRALLAHLETEEGVAETRVLLVPAEAPLDEPSRLEHADMVQFYLRAGFRLTGKRPGELARRP